MTLLWLLDEAWATIEPHLPKNQPRRPARGRPAGDLRHPVCAQGWLSLVRLPGRLRPVDDGVQPVQPLVAPELLAEAAERAGRCRRGNEEHRDRQHLREGATRRLWRKKGGRYKHAVAGRPRSTRSRRRRPPLCADAHRRHRQRHQGRSRTSPTRRAHALSACRQGLRC